MSSSVNAREAKLARAMLGFKKTLEPTKEEVN
jgi:hypothetical protein